MSLIFKKVFGEKGNEDILISFINAVLKRTKKEPIVEVEIINNKQLTILVKKFNSVGSVVYGSNDSKEVDMIDDLLNYKLEGKDKQVVLLSNLEMWKEYEPFNIVNSVGEFIDSAILN